MCGIGGMAGGVDRGVLTRMMTSLQHRGPDDAGEYVDDHVALGHRRLSIIDVRGSHQPISNEDGTLHLVANGEIYNYRELRAGLAERGHRFTTDGDCETILHLYEEKGDACVERLNGMFAFALWDARKGRLRIARDRLGIKPLLYSVSGGSLLFASELKALLAGPRVDRQIDPEGLDLYLTFRYVPAPWTILKGIRKLPPGHALVWEKGEVSVRQYWSLPEPGEHRGSTDMASAAEEVREKLLDAVGHRLISDVPLGAYLSGGLDSSVIVGMMSQASPDPVSTFSVGFRESGYDESAHARAVAEHFGTDHHALTVERDASFAELPRILWHLDEPVADAAAIPTYQMARATKEHVTVVLTGEGADELFAGYSHYKFLTWTGRLGRALIPFGLLSPVSRLGGYFANIGDRVKAYLALKSVFTARERSALLADAQASDLAHDLVARYMGPAASGDRLDQLLRCDLALWLPDDLLVKVDRMTMAHAVEARVPFLDHRFVEHVMGLPSRFKLSGTTGKALLRRVGADLLPARTATRRKQGFSVPVERWLRDHDLLMALLGPEAIERRGLLRPGPVAALADRGGHNVFTRRQLWSLVTLELWCRVMLDRDPIGPPNAGEGVSA